MLCIPIQRAAARRFGPRATIAAALLGGILLLGGCRRQPGPASTAPLTEQEARGQRLYQTHCLRCHRDTSPEPLHGPSMFAVYRQRYLPSGAPANDDRIADAILRGRAKMPAYRDLLDDQQLLELLAYMKRL